MIVSYNKGNIRHFTLKNPYREVFDIPNARLRHSRVGKGLQSSHCHSIRISQYRPNTVRIVLETGKGYACNPYRPVLSYKSYHIPLPRFKVTKKSSVHMKQKRTKVGGRVTQKEKDT